MKISTVLFVILYAIISCNANMDVKKLKATETFTLAINNLDKNAIGYQHFEDDMDIGINSMFVFRNIIYFPDTYHKNIKAFNIETEILIASEELFPWITDIVIYNQKIYVVSEYDGLIILDLSLNIVDKKIQLPKGYKYFVEYNEDVYIVNSSVIERTGNIVAYECYSLSSLISNEYQKISLFSDALPERIGFFDSEIMLAGKLYLEARSFNYEIAHPLSKIKDYDAFNIFVGNNQITYYYIDENYLKIEVFKY
jgi:hypothetical protein